MKPLQPLFGGFNSFATGANNTGLVVGWAENGVHDTLNCMPPQVLQFRPVTWSPDADQPAGTSSLSGRLKRCRYGDQ